MSANIPKVSTRFSLPKALPKDLPSALHYIQSLIREIQNQQAATSAVMSGLVGADVLANRPPTALSGATFYATDNSHFYVFTGSAWHALV